ncbi:hypothetical protein B9Z55_014197 [Caenorhabditis nigoni]|uniref:Uncharacterized protein n=1 Tax=Caenorhabditis nigoni TaxID=1611254 RepID=A0A2G5U4V8_9PELO|nr:hypothetical protein B9Z55_014197 [Caenorhabditis nigoni]
MPENEEYARIIPFNNDESELTIFQETVTDVGGVIWDSALMTIHYFFKHPAKFEGLGTRKWDWSLRNRPCCPIVGLKKVTPENLGRGACVDLRGGVAKTQYARGRIATCRTPIISLLFSTHFLQ